MRATVPGGEKALVISKFDALGQKTDKLIPTLYHGGIWWSGMENDDDVVVVSELIWMVGWWMM